MTVTVADLPLVGGHPALDLVNTVAPRLTPDERATEEAGAQDFLADPSTMLVWAGRAGVVDAEEARRLRARWVGSPAAGHSALAAVVDVRECLFAALLTAISQRPDPLTTADARAGSGAPESPLSGLHSRWVAAAGRGAFTPAEGTALAVAATTEPDLIIADRLLLGAVDLLGTAPRSRLRRCPPGLGGCGWLMLDTTRNGSRRWCRMADCGNQAKSRRLTDRRRRARTSAAQDPPDAGPPASQHAHSDDGAPR